MLKITDKDKIGDTNLVYSGIKGARPIEYILAYGPDFKKVWIISQKGYAIKSNINELGILKNKG